MTVFPQDNKCPKVTVIQAREENTAHREMDFANEWTKIKEDDYGYTGKLDGKHESKMELAEAAEGEEMEQDDEGKLRVKEEKVAGGENMKFRETKTEDTDAKPSHSYIALIAMAILSRPGKKVLLGDIYNYISEKFPYYRTKDKSWRNSIRHNLSLNECFIKAGRSENGKGNYWAIHPANVEDFANGDFRRRRARRRVRKSHSALCTRYPGLPFHQPAQAYINYRSAEMYPHPYYITSFNMQNCVRKNSFAIDSLLSSRVPTALSSASGLQGPTEYGSLSVPVVSSTAFLRSYSPSTAFTSLPSPGNHCMGYPLALTSNTQAPTESWQETWKKLKAQFQTQS